MSELLSKIKTGVKHTKMVLWPGSDQSVMLRILSEQERQEAAFAAERYFVKESVSIHMGTVDEYETEKANQMLWRVLRDPATQGQLTKTIAEFRAQITRDERTALVNEYVTFERDVSPSPENMTADEWTAFVEDVKKKPEETLGSFSSSNTLRKLVTTLAAQLSNSQPPSGLSFLRSKKRQQ